MRSVDWFLLQYAALVFSTVTLLSMLGLDSIDIYVALFIIEFFVVSQLSSPLIGLESTRRNVVAIVLLLVFAGIVAIRIIKILQ